MGAHVADTLIVLAGAMRAQRSLTERQSLGRMAFLRSAARHVPFYRRHFQGSEPSGVEDFPLIDRRMLADDPNLFLDENWPAEVLTWNTTSGTSGRALAIARDPVSAYAMTHGTFATLWALLGLPAERCRPGQCAAITLNDNPLHQTFDTVNPSLNMAVVRRAVLGKGDDVAVAADIAASKPSLICGRPRALLRLAEIVSEERLSINPGALFCSGDNLYATDRAELRATFGAEVYNGYASQECGLVAVEQQGSDAGMYPVGDKLIEILPDGCIAPEPHGVGELVVTSFANWAMPIIRYRTGDVGDLRLDAGNLRLARLDGRSSVYFRIGGERINPSIFNALLESVSRQFRMVHHDGDILCVTIVPKPALDGNEVAERVKSQIALIAPGATIILNFADTIGVAGQKVQRYAVGDP